MSNSFNPTNDDKQVGDFGPGAGKVSYGTRSPLDYLRKKTGGTMGPIDPLTMREQGTAVDYRDSIDHKTSDEKIVTLMDMFQEFMNEAKAEHPVVRLRVQAGLGTTVQGPWKVDNTQSYEFFFMLSGKKVTAQKLFIQNNSAQTIYFNWGEPATPGKGALVGGSFINMEAEVDNLNLQTAASALNVNGDVAGHIFVAAWGSEDQMYQKGSA